MTGNNSQHYSADLMVTRWQRRAGMTLIEILIVAAVFSVTILLATTVFIGVQSTQRGIQARQRVVADGRYMMETIARSIRTSMINYNYYNESGVYQGQIPTEGANIISLTDQYNTYTCYQLSGSKLQVISPATSECESTEDSQWEDITPTDLNIEQLLFYINPQSDPFRKVPAVDNDCKYSVPHDINGQVIEGLDATKGACACYVTSIAAPGYAPNDCFTDQQCSSTQHVGQGCATQADISVAPVGVSSDSLFWVDDANNPSSETGCVCTNANTQPQVTILMKTRSTNTAPGEQAESIMQTTVVSRVYRR